MKNNNEKGFNDLVKTIKSLNSGLNKLIEEQALPYWREEIDCIIKKKITDTRRIEKCLNYIGDFITLGKGDEEYKKLLKYYRKIDPEAAESYQRIYEQIVYDSTH